MTGPAREPMPARFAANQTHTIGVEIELQLVDGGTLALSNSIQQLLERTPDKWEGKIKPELMQSYCEFNTGICSTVREVERDLFEKVEWGQTLAQELRVALASSSVGVAALLTLNEARDVSVAADGQDPQVLEATQSVDAQAQRRIELDVSNVGRLRITVGTEQEVDALERALAELAR